MKIRDMVYISIFAGLTAIGARISIPVPFVPFTLQTLFCMIAGLVLGSKGGAASQALYMLMGLVGIPVFTGGGGIGSILTPSFGYVLGFIACGWLSGRLIEYFTKNGNIPTTKEYFVASLAGVAAVYVLGLIHLYIIMNFWMPGNGMPLFKVLSVGLFSTIGGDFIKAFLASNIASRLNKAGIFKIT